MFARDAFNSDEVELMKAAFDAAWKFVATDTALEAVSAADRRLSLAQALMALVSAGERDRVRLANQAIALVRKIQTPSPRERLRQNSIVRDPRSEPPVFRTPDVAVPSSEPE
jgi:hypothetical protein